MYRKLKRDHRGFSLVEVLVSMLVASVIVLAIGGIISIGTRVYRTTNEETELQKESQIAMNLIHDIMIKAIEYKYINVSSDVEVLLITTGREEGDGVAVTNNYYAISLDKVNHRLLFSKTTNNMIAVLPEDWAIAAANDEVISLSPSLLAKYVETITVSPNEGRSSNKDTVQITLDLKISDKLFSTFTTIKLRNS